MPKLSAGLLVYRRREAGVEVLIAHMGGPYWVGKDERAWSIPKGEYVAGEDPLTVARREFEEELGQPAPDAAYRRVGEFRQGSGKLVTVFAAELDAGTEVEVDSIVSNTFPLEWPPRSGAFVDFPEIDEARWVSLDEARRLLVAGQVPALEELG